MTWLASRAYVDLHRTSEPDVGSVDGPTCFLDLSSTSVTVCWSPEETGDRDCPSSTQLWVCAAMRPHLRETSAQDGSGCPHRRRASRRFAERRTDPAYG